MNDHARWEDAAGAYVLGAMATRERNEFEAHLVTCAVCQEEVDDLRPAAEALPMASPPLQPPTALKDRIMAEVEREAELLGAAGAGADRPERTERRPRRSWLGGWRLAPVAAALLIAGVLAGAVLTGPDSRTIDFEGQSAQLKIEGDQATIVAEGLEPPPGDRQYEVWVMQKGSKTPQATNVLFTPSSDGSAEAAVPVSVDDIDQVLVTDEPRGGSKKPTGKLLMAAKVS